MTELLDDDDPEPADRHPAGRLFVPVRPGPRRDTLCVFRIFRTPLGGRTAVGFTSLRRLTATLGREQAWIELAEPALRALLAPLGITLVTVDPQLSAPAPAPASLAPATPAPLTAALTAGAQAVTR